MGRLLDSARTWINDPQLATGGPLADIGVHCFDTLRYVLGDEVISVMAQAHYDSHWVVEASGTTLFQFAGGTLATMSVSARAPYQTLLEVIGENGIITAHSVTATMQVSSWDFMRTSPFRLVVASAAARGDRMGSAASVSRRNSDPIGFARQWRAHCLCVTFLFLAVTSGS